jgi:hypothetical protein
MATPEPNPQVQTLCGMGLGLNVEMNGIWLSSNAIVLEDLVSSTVVDDDTITNKPTLSMVSNLRV